MLEVDSRMFLIAASFLMLFVELDLSANSRKYLEY
jgi:hypothetical protein